MATKKAKNEPLPGTFPYNVKKYRKGRSGTYSYDPRTSRAMSSPKKSEKNREKVKTIGMHNLSLEASYNSALSTVYSRLRALGYATPRKRNGSFYITGWPTPEEIENMNEEEQAALQQLRNYPQRKVD